MRNPELKCLHEAVCRRLYRRGLHRGDLDVVVVEEVPALDATFWDNALTLDDINLHAAALPYLQVSPVLFADRLGAEITSWQHKGYPTPLNSAALVARALGTNASAVSATVRPAADEQTWDVEVALLAMQAARVASALAPRGLWTKRLFHCGSLTWGVDETEAWFGNVRLSVKPQRKPWTCHLRTSPAEGCMWARAWRWLIGAFDMDPLDPLCQALLVLHWTMPCRPPRSEDAALWNRLIALQIVPGRLSEVEQALQHPISYKRLKDLLVPVLVPAEDFVELFGRTFSGDAPKEKRLDWLSKFAVIKDAHKFAL